MSDQRGATALKTVAIKVTDELHAQLLIVAQLEGKSLTEVIRTAVEQYVEQLRTGDGLAARAQALLDEIEQETAGRKQAVQALLSELGEAPAAPAKRARRSAPGESPA